MRETNCTTTHAIPMAPYGSRYLIPPRSTVPRLASPPHARIFRALIDQLNQQPTPEPSCLRQSPVEAKRCRPHRWPSHSSNSGASKICSETSSNSTPQTSTSASTGSSTTSVTSSTHSYQPTSHATSKKNSPKSKTSAIREPSTNSTTQSRRSTRTSAQTPSTRTAMSSRN